MMKFLFALLSGLVFGAGLVVSEMTNPEKVLGFLDLFGNWDPSLALVMGAALIVTAIGYRLVWMRRQPIVGDSFHLPTNSQVDWRLASGALLFGIGWGLVGLCPGPAIAALSFGGVKLFYFVGSMSVGMLLFAVVRTVNSSSRPT